MEFPIAFAYMQRLFFIFSLACQTGCSLWSEDPQAYLAFENYEMTKPQDLMDHLLHIGKVAAAPNKVKHIKLSSSSLRYLKNIVDRIIENNEILFQQSVKPKFFILDLNKPIYFSLPGAHFYFSKGFLKKFMRHEGILASVLARESIRSLRGIYPATEVVPLPEMELSRLLLMLQVDLEVDHEINKWSYHALKRTSYREINYLLWLQIKNKNMIDFSYQTQSVKNFARQEQLFKSFLISEGYEQGLAEDLGNSSPRFYQFLEEVRNL